MTGFATGSFLAGLGYSVLAVVAVLGVTFAVALRQHRHTVIDVAWGLGFVAVAAVSTAGGGDLGRRLLLLALTGVWGVRLATHIGRRSRGTGEDPRYTEMLDRAPGNRTRYALRAIYLTQGVVLFLVSLPLQVGANERAPLSAASWLGIVVYLVGLGFEAVGDWQLERFKADPSHHGQVLDTGLWRYTRHPNYFGDACVWWGLWLTVAVRWPGVLTIPAPLVMTYLLAKGTGKPLLESRLATTRPGYADYVARTSGFLPWPPRRRTA